MTTNTKLGTPTNDFYNQQIMMTLAEIAYAAPSDLACQLAYPYYATKGQWTLRWLGESPGNQMYAASNQKTGQWVVSIRGSVTDPMSEAFWVDWFEEDLDTLVMKPPPFDTAPGALISWGTLEGFLDLISMKDAKSGLNLVDFLSQNVNLEPTTLLVTGHSLGGCLATVLAPYLYETLCKPANKSPDCIVPMTFAGPTAGNSQFATYMADLFGGFPFRYFNKLDIVPHSWSLEGLDWIMGSYDPAPVIPDAFWWMVDGLYEVLNEGDYNYTQPGTGDAVAGVLQQNYWWIHEAGYQHMGETYLAYYQAPPVIFPCPKKSPVVGVRPSRKLKARK